MSFLVRGYVPLHARSSSSCFALNPIADVELKQRIDAFLAERRNKHTAYDVPAEDIVHMDVS